MAAAKDAPTADATTIASYSGQSAFTAWLFTFWVLVVNVAQPKLNAMPGSVELSPGAG
jgi:hypothetical protein